MKSFVVTLEVVENNATTKPSLGKIGLQRNGLVVARQRLLEALQVP